MKDVKSLFQVVIAMILLGLYVVVNLFSEDVEKDAKRVSAELSSIHQLNPIH